MRKPRLFPLLLVVLAVAVLALLELAPVSAPRPLTGLVAAAWLVLAVAPGLAIVEVVQARRQLHHQAQALAATEKLSRDWVWESDLERRLTYSNDAVRTLLGYDAADLLGRSCDDLIVPEALPRLHALMDQNVQERGTPVPDGPLEAPWQHADGHTVIVQGTTEHLYDEHGRVIGYRGVRQLLTDAMVAERAVAASAARVMRVLSDQAFDIALQPIIDLETGRLAGAEALARFRDGRPADVWFREAQESGLALDLDRMAFLSALELLSVLPPTCELSINATPELLTDRAFQEALRSPELPAERLVVEITEHVRISSYADVAEALAPLRELGIRLAVDDTGAGFASLTHVLQLRPDIIKIDRSLVKNITSDPARRSIVTSLVLLALDLGATVTAEGVETQSELETVSAMGADRAQGYLLARPTTDRARWRRWWERDWLRTAASSGTHRVPTDERG